MVSGSLAKVSEDRPFGKRWAIYAEKVLRVEETHIIVLLPHQFKFTTFGISPYGIETTCSEVINIYTGDKLLDNKSGSTLSAGIPNKAFDSEYMTERKKEVEYLDSLGIHYTYIRKTPYYHIRQYKYKKTPELFLALAEFYRTFQPKPAEGGTSECPK